MTIKIDLGSGNSIAGYETINVILGKNGSGKSTLLRQMDARLESVAGCIRYITPERGGQLTHDGNVETSRSSNPNWLPSVRRKNQWNQFRQSSVAEYRNLETLVLRSIEGDRDIRSSDFTFDSEVGRINKILDRVQLRRSAAAGFSLVHKDSGEEVKPDALSSGESELISLAVEILYFAYLCKQEEYSAKDNWLLLDEPDVHLHPDLQHKLMELLASCIANTNGRVIIATHSTAILSSLCGLSPNVRVGLKTLDQRELVFQEVSNPMRSVLPMFGAHPLSNVFNEKPPLIVEGEDDERIWQSAVRRSEGRITLFPCVAGDVQTMNEYETAAQQIIETVYENAKAYSLRDRDEEPYEITNCGPITRYRLNCRTAENLIVTEDVLSILGTTWDELRLALEKWIIDNPEHSRHSQALAFQAGGWDRRSFPLKELRMILVGITGSSKPWEVAVGQAIAGLWDGGANGEHSLREYLGLELVTELNLVR